MFSILLFHVLYWNFIQLTMYHIWYKMGYSIKWLMNHALVDTTFYIQFNCFNLRSNRVKPLFYKSIPLRFIVYVSNGHFLTDVPSTSGWTHIVLNYIGHEDGQGIRIYTDGVQVGTETARSSGSDDAGDGRVAIGRWVLTMSNWQYTSLQLDELMFFNAKLTDSEITILSQL